MRLAVGRLAPNGSERKSQEQNGQGAFTFTEIQAFSHPTGGGCDPGSSNDTMMASASSLTRGSPTRNGGKKPGTPIKTPAMNYGSFSFEARRKEQQAGLAAREARLSMLEAVVVEQEELLDPWSRLRRVGRPLWYDAPADLHPLMRRAYQCTWPLPSQRGSLLLACVWQAAPSANS